LPDLLGKFGPNRNGVTGEWRGLCSEELQNHYSLTNVTGVIKGRRMKLAGHVARVGDKRGAYKALVGRPDRKRLLERSRHIWDDNMELGPNEVEWGA
jgi:hypothetical protein